MLAKRLGLPATIVKIDVVRKHRLAKGSFEEVARLTRFEFLFKLAKEIHADRVALGHTLDDQAETVLMRILRGTGLYGLSAIVPKRLIFGHTVIRPLLYVKRKEIESYLKMKRIIPRRDITNNEEKYFRNRVRKTLLPLLEDKFNTNSKEALCTMADIASCDYDYLRGVVEKKLKHVNRRRIPLTLLRLQHPSLRRLMIRFAIAKVKDDTRAITFGHIREIEDLIANRPAGSIVDLAKQVTVAKKKNCLFFYLRTKR
jgi:tRNA(Ile)-lysidine synthase